MVSPEQPNGEHIPAATLHSDMGCDTYANSIPAGAGDGVHPLKCEASDEEKRVAQKDHAWWQATLGEFYSGFFDEEHYPRPNFRKIMHIHVTDSIIGRYKAVKARPQTASANETPLPASRVATSRGAIHLLLPLSAPS